MGHKIKIQQVERGVTKSFYVNFPVALAEAAPVERGEEMERLVEDRNTFVLRRMQPKKPSAKGKSLSVDAHAFKGRRLLSKERAVWSDYPHTALYCLGDRRK